MVGSIKPQRVLICPMDGNCLASNIIYQATVNTENAKHTYIGLTSTKFKARLANHLAAFKKAELANSCKLAQLIWQLKETNTEYNITWKLISRANIFSPTTGVCNLCTKEKYYILYRPDMASVNTRSELISSCRHKSSQLLDKG